MIPKETRSKEEAYSSEEPVDIEPNSDTSLQMPAHERAQLQ